MTITVELTCRACPVHIEGEVDGQPFYFRARGQHWSMGIGGDPVMEPKWYRRRQWSEEQFAAGWMDPDVAAALVHECVDAYRAGEPSDIRDGPTQALIELMTRKPRWAGDGA